MITSRDVLNGVQNNATSVAKRQLLQNGAIIDVKTIDERSLIQRLDKMSLYRLLDANGHGHVINENMEYNKMQAYATVYQDDLDWSKVSLVSDGFGGILVKKPMAHILKEREYDKDVQKKRKALAKLSPEELHKLAIDKGLTPPAGATVADYVEALSA